MCNGNVKHLSFYIHTYSLQRLSPARADYVQMCVISGMIVEELMRRCPKLVCPLGRLLTSPPCSELAQTVIKVTAVLGAIFLSLGVDP